MQKVNNQRLQGSKEQAELDAIWTWQKDEIAYYFSSTTGLIYKVQFTGKHWLIGNKWGYNKIYQYKYLDSNGSMSVDRLGLDYDGISHGDEREFFTHFDFAYEQAGVYFENTFKRAQEDYNKQIEHLEQYKNGF